MNVTLASSPVFQMNESYGTRQINILLGEKRFAVINSSLHKNKWSCAKLVILRADLSIQEIQALPEVSRKALEIIPHLSKDVVDYESLDVKIQEINYE